MLPQPRRHLWTFAALVVLLAQPARADVPDAGAPRDAAGAMDGAGATAAEDAAPALPPAPPELATPPELSSAQTTTNTPLIDNPTPAQAEPPRPITRRLWFWMAITGVVIGAVVAGIAIENPNTTKPDCPSGYVCPR